MKFLVTIDLPEQFDYSLNRRVARMALESWCRDIWWYGDDDERIVAPFNVEVVE